MRESPQQVRARQVQEVSEQPAYGWGWSPRRQYPLVTGHGQGASHVMIHPTTAPPPRSALAKIGTFAAKPCLEVRNL